MFSRLLTLPYLWLLFHANGVCWKSAFHSQNKEKEKIPLLKFFFYSSFYFLSLTNSSIINSVGNDFESFKAECLYVQPYKSLNFYIPLNTHKHTHLHSHNLSNLQKKIRNIYARCDKQYEHIKPGHDFFSSPRLGNGKIEQYSNNCTFLANITVNYNTLPGPF